MIDEKQNEIDKTQNPIDEIDKILDEKNNADQLLTSVDTFQKNILMTVNESDTENKENSDISRKFEEIRNDPSQPVLTRDLLKEERFMPKEVLEIDGKKFYMGDIFNTEKYEQSIMFVERNGKMMPRVFYKSNSDGGWRSCLGFVNGTYCKGINIHYTQETRPHEAILEYFNRLKNDDKPSSEDLIFEKFSFKDRVRMEEIYSFDDEVSKYDDDGVLNGPQQYKPGFGFSQEFRISEGLSTKVDVADFVHSCDNLPEGFIPEFNKGPKNGPIQGENTLLGQIKIETYESVLNGRKVDWKMAYDKEGRVWVDSIKFTDGEVNSYGIFSEVIDSGSLTNKPIEYKTRTDALDSTSAISFSSDYSDITPLIDQLRFIKDFRKARKIYRSEVEEESSTDQKNDGKLKHFFRQLLRKR